MGGSRHGWTLAHKPGVVRDLAHIAAPMLLALLVAACGAGATGGGNPHSKANATATPAASSQDILQAPVSPPVTTTPTTRSRATAHKSFPTGVPAAPSDQGFVILVSLSRQQLYAYENGVFAFSTLVETGRPELPTPTGVYHVFQKACSDLRWVSNSGPTAQHNAICAEHTGDGFQEMFTSPWPKGSPYWYAPTHINYALKFREDGFYLHDAWWHVAFGPGSNVPHQLPDGSWETGSHGCVGMTIASAAKIYAWAPIGTAVYVRADI